MVENNDIAISAWGDLYEPVSKMLQSAGTAASEMNDNFGGLSNAQTRAASEIAGVAERLAGLAQPLSEAAEALMRLSGAMNSLSAQASQENDKKGAEGFSWPRPFWFLTEDKEYENAKNKYIQDLDEMHDKLEEVFGVEKAFSFMEELFGKYDEFTAKNFSAITGYDELHKQSVDSVTAVRTNAFTVMENQLLKLVETHKFSVSAFGDAMAEQVKIELTGLAAKAAVWAIFETAMGLKDLAWGAVPTAMLHFKSAAEFGAVAGLSLAGAAAIQESFFGGASEEESSSSSGSSSSTSSSSGLSLDSGTETKSTQNVTVHIYNPLSDQNWQKIVEDNIIPALQEAGDRNISVTVKNMG